MTSISVVSSFYYIRLFDSVTSVMLYSEFFSVAIIFRNAKSSLINANNTKKGEDWELLISMASYLRFLLL